MGQEPGKTGGGRGTGDEEERAGSVISTRVGSRREIPPFIVPITNFFKLNVQIIKLNQLIKGYQLPEILLAFNFEIECHIKLVQNQNRFVKVFPII